MTMWTLQRFGAVCIASGGMRAAAVFAQTKNQTASGEPKQASFEALDANGG